MSNKGERNEEIGWCQPSKEQSEEIVEPLKMKDYHSEEAVLRSIDLEEEDDRMPTCKEASIQPGIGIEKWRVSEEDPSFSSLTIPR